MGQYYMVKVNDKVYNREVNGQYTMAKLMEHSWWENSFVNTICHEIFKKPKTVAWVGDYSNEENKELYESVWGEKVKTYGINEAQVSLSGKFLVNHTKLEYLNCSKYYENSVDKEGWCINPLPLLTSIGNGNGGGDYCGTDMEYVGKWCNDEISVELEKPEGFIEYIEIEPVFKEE